MDFEHAGANDKTFPMTIVRSGVCFLIYNLDGLAIALNFLFKLYFHLKLILP